MRVYTEYTKNIIQENFTYRFDYVFRLIGRLLSLLIQISIWRALMSNTGQANTSMGVITLGDMISYSIVSTLFTTIINNNVTGRIGDKVRSGQITMDLIKPINFRTLIFCDLVGNNTFTLIFDLLPILGISAIVFGIQLPSIQNALLCIISVINGFVINFMIAYIFGILAFWLVSLNVFIRTYSDMINLFSGSWIPIWFFPNVLITISNYLPFRLIFFAPIAIFLNKYNLTASLFLIAQQFLWILILYLISKFIWSRVIIKLHIHGG